MSEIKHLEKLIGYFLDVMKFTSEEDDKLQNVGVTIESCSKLSETSWDCIKTLVGMPEKEELGVWISDLWYNFAFDYIEEKISKSEAIKGIVNWRNDFKD